MALDEVEQVCGRACCVRLPVVQFPLLLTFLVSLSESRPALLPALVLESAPVSALLLLLQ